MPTPRVRAAAEGIPTVPIFTPTMTAAVSRAERIAQPRRAKAFGDLEGQISRVLRMAEALLLAAEDRGQREGDTVVFTEDTFWTVDFLMGEVASEARKLEAQWTAAHNAACTDETNSFGLTL